MNISCFPSAQLIYKGINIACIEVLHPLVSDTAASERKTERREGQLSPSIG